jgi:hypothetical protein
VMAGTEAGDAAAAKPFNTHVRFLHSMWPRATKFGQLSGPTNSTIIGAVPLGP